MYRLTRICLALAIFCIIQEVSAQQSSALLSRQYELTDADIPGYFSNPVRAAGVYFNSGSDFIRSAFTVDQDLDRIIYLIARNDILVRADVYGDGGGEIAFNAPEGIDVDESGNLYVADTGNNRIVRLNVNFTTGAITHVSNITGISNPVDVVITNSSFWVLSASQNKVSQYSLSGSLQYSLGSSGSGNGKFSSPRGISARQSNGTISSSDIYVADTGNDRVVFFTKGSSSGNYSAWNTVSISNSNLTDIASDPDGNAYVMDAAQGKLHVAGWFGKDYLGYSSESFNQPKNVNFARGKYELGTIEAWTQNSGVSQYDVRVDILNLSAGASGSNVTFSYILMANAAMTGKVKNSSGQVVRDLITNLDLAASSNHQHTWDGKNNSGNSVPAGQYTFELTASTSHGQNTKSVTFTYNGGGDTTPPAISNVSAGNITSSGATITWTTNENSDSQVEYGLTTSYGNTTPLNTSLVTSHSMILSGLSANKLYHYRVKSKDASGNSAVSSDFTFTSSDNGLTTRIEAESMTLSNYTVESNASWSGGNGIKLSTTNGTARTNPPAAGTYNVKVVYLDEADGPATIEIRIGGTLVDSWTLNQNTDQLFSRTVVTGYNFNANSVFEIKGIKNNGEYARIDYVEFTASGGGCTTYTLTTNVQGSGSVSLSPSGGSYCSGTQVTVTANPASGWTFQNWSGGLSGSTNPATITMTSNKTVTAVFQQSGGGGGDTTRIEAESMTLSNYIVESNASWSGGNGIKLDASSGTARTNPPAAGTYNVRVRYFDEVDGPATIEIRIGGTLVDSWTLNLNTDQSYTRTVVTGYNFNSNTVFEIKGIRNSGEHARVDYVEFTENLAKRAASDSDAPQATVPDRLSLIGNFPNPFNPSTNIRFTVPAAMEVSLEIYNITGQRIRTILSAAQTLGEHSIMWDGRDDDGLISPSGVYVYRLKGGGFVTNGRMSLVK